MNLEHMTTVAAGERFAGDHLAVITCGATEQHGPHLPLGTDTISGWALAQRLAEEIPCILVPPLSIGCSRYHLSWPGTVSISADTMTAIIYEVAESLKHHGTTRLLIINSHGGNKTAVDIAAARIVDELGLDTSVAYFQSLAYKCAAGEMDLGHAGHIETAMVLRQHPETVRLDQAEGGEDFATALARERAFSARDLYRPMSDWAQVAPAGWFGDARAASAEQASVLLDRMVRRLTAFLADKHAHDPVA